MSAQGGDSGEVAQSLAALGAELLEGPPQSGGYVLNRGDVGLHRSLAKLSAEAASAVTPGGSSVAAHVAHLTYAMSLLCRWSQGENPWATADWSASWKRTHVTEQEWADLLHEFRAVSEKWLEVLHVARTVDQTELTGLIGSVAHLAYHIGALRQIDRNTRGPG